VCGDLSDRLAASDALPPESIKQSSGWVYSKKRHTVWLAAGGACFALELLAPPAPAPDLLLSDLIGMYNEVMKVYFTASLTGKRILGENYRAIFYTLKDELGCQMLNDNILTDSVDIVARKTKEELAEFCNRSRRLLHQADLVVVEASYPSTNVGYEISVAAELGKFIAVLHVKDEKPILLATVDYDMINVYPYTLTDVKQVLKQVIADTQSSQEVRFNFLLPRYLSSYLNWIAKRRRLPRSVYLRQLIEDDMRANPEYLYPSDRPAKS